MPPSPSEIIRMQRLKLFLPLIVFAVLALFFFVVQKQISRGEYDPQNMPSALIDKPLPEFVLPALLDDSTVRRTDVIGQPFLVNIWATWCPTCAAEHTFLNQIAAQGVVILGVDYKDEQEKARRWIAERGNPYRWSVQDPQGTFGLDLGVTGAPETYVVDAKGIIRMRHQGDLNERVWTQKIAPLLEQLRREGSS
jgi:cytochrome c biogenesis protein CcmG/thiol:disulfide interchange protein DsbE